MICSVRMGGSLNDLHVKEYGCSILGVIVALAVLIMLLVFWPSALTGQVIITGTAIDYVLSLILIVAPITVLVLMVRRFSKRHESSHFDKELQF